MLNKKVNFNDLILEEDEDFMVIGENGFVYAIYDKGDKNALFFSVSESEAKNQNDSFGLGMIDMAPLQFREEVNRCLMAGEFDRAQKFPYKEGVIKDYKSRN